MTSRAKIRITAASFIPWAWVRFPAPGSPLHLYVRGDGRTPGSRPPTDKFRTIQIIDVLLTPSGFTFDDLAGWRAMVNSSTSQIRDDDGNIKSELNKVGKPEDYSEAHTVDISQDRRYAEIRMSLSAGVPTDIGGPQGNIDFSYMLSLHRKETGTFWTLRAEHDGFPAHEVFLEVDTHVLFSNSYVPSWFATEKIGAGTIAKPNVFQSAKGAAALAGLYERQKTQFAGKL